ncbi:MAG: hypothetical protein [Olavius algarvensis Delta 4 endosymbiont]|nr:MAG: hypothetical protein [Olavius algarvensis Delta 4 endosymbiont]
MNPISADGDRGNAANLRQALALDRGGVVCLVGAGGKTSLMFRLASELAANGQRILTTTTTKISEQEAAANSPMVITGPVAALLPQVDAPGLPGFITAARSGSAKKLLGFKAKDIERIWQAGVFNWILIEADGAARLPLKVPDAHEPVIPACCRYVVGVAGLTALNKPLTDQWVFRLPLFARLTGLAPGDRITSGSVAASLSHPRGIFKGCPAQARQTVFLNQAETSASLAAGRRVVKELAARERPAALERAVLGQLKFDPPVIEIFDF